MVIKKKVDEQGLITAAKENVFVIFEITLRQELDARINQLQFPCS
jgi:hypothetical protein